MAAESPASAAGVRPDDLIGVAAGVAVEPGPHLVGVVVGVDLVVARPAEVDDRHLGQMPAVGHLPGPVGDLERARIRLGALGLEVQVDVDAADLLVQVDELLGRDQAPS